MDPLHFRGDGNGDDIMAALALFNHTQHFVARIYSPEDPLFAEYSSLKRDLTICKPRPTDTITLLAGVVEIQAQMQARLEWNYANQNAHSFDTPFVEPCPDVSPYLHKGPSSLVRNDYGTAFGYLARQLVRLGASPDALPDMREIKQFQKRTPVDNSLFVPINAPTEVLPNLSPVLGAKALKASTSDVILFIGNAPLRATAIALHRSEKTLGTTTAARIALDTIYGTARKALPEGFNLHF